MNLRWILPALIGLVSGVILLWSSGQVPELVFDEQYYIPSARQIMAFEPNTYNYSHPPLAKELMVVGMLALGDQPLGWRVGSVVFGVLTLLALFELGLFLFSSPVWAAVGPLAAVFNGIFFPMSSLALIDIFMLGFSLWGVVFFLRGLRSSPFWHIGAAILFGASIACKWAGVFFLGPCLVVLVFEEWPKRARVFGVIGLYVVGSVLTYAATFIPYLFVEAPGHTLQGLVDLQWAILKVHTHESELNPLRSSWYEWPFRLEPMWLLIRPLNDAANSLKAVFLFGNPWVFLAGAAGFWKILRGSKGPAVWLLGILFFSTYLIWGLLPRANTYYHYFLPASLLLCLGFAEVCRRTYLATGWRWLVVIGALVVVPFFLSRALFSRHTDSHGNS